MEKISLKSGLVNIEYYGEPDELAVHNELGKFVDDEVYFYPEFWKDVPKKFAKDLMDELNSLVERAVEPSGEIKNHEIILEIEKVLDHKGSSGELFGAETYNGWEFEDGTYYGDLSHEEAVISTAMYCISKCAVFLDYEK